MYKTIIFDLDDTLNDDTKNMQEAFKILTKDKYSDEEFKKFQTIDKNYWKERAAGIVKDPREGMSKAEKAEWNRAQRFLRYFKGISYKEAVKMNEIYTEGLKRKVQEIEGAKEIIKYLKDKKYKLIIASNGPSTAIPSKLKGLGINEYIDETFAADECGSMKPHAYFYEALFNKINNHNTKEMLYIGDELEKDIKGGNEVGMDTCWFNIRNENASIYKPTYEIHKLEELKNIL